MRKRTFLDKKFSQGNSNSQAFRDSWERMFGNGESTEPVSTQLPTPTPNQEQGLDLTDK